ncbi:MAG: Holliday junction resolvase RuvX [Acidobacteriota bacterium]
MLGVDFGEKQIGLALSDPTGAIALPRGVLERTTDRRAVYALAAIAREENVGLIAVGCPRHVDGSPTAMTERTARFARKLARAARLPVRLVEETLTSREAVARLRAAGYDERRRSDRRDAIAAQLIVEDALGGAGRALDDASEGAS